jgi:hypothetical protein
LKWVAGKLASVGLLPRVLEFAAANNLLDGVCNYRSCCSGASFWTLEGASSQKEEDFFDSLVSRMLKSFASLYTIVAPAKD